MKYTTKAIASPSSHIGCTRSSLQLSATSSSRELVAACLRPFNLQGRFRFVLAAEDIAHGKPHPEIYLTAARRFGISPAEMLVLAWPAPKWS